MIKAMKVLIFIGAFALLVVSLLLLSGLILEILWNFLAPTFNLPIIGLGQGVAISVLLSVISSYFKVYPSRKV